jgi:hypothetical protein
MNRYVGNLPPMPGVFPDYPAPVVRNDQGEREIVMMRWGMPPPPRTGGYPVTNIRNRSSPVGLTRKIGRRSEHLTPWDDYRLGSMNVTVSSSWKETK